MPGNVPTGISTGKGSLFSTEVLKSLANGTRFLMPAGTYYFYGLGADVVLQIIDSTGAWHSITVAGTTPSGVYISDGASLALYNPGSGSESATYIQLP